MKNKKLFAVLGTATLLANMGLASIAFAQTQSVGTQTIACPGDVTSGPAPSVTDVYSISSPAASFTFPTKSATNKYDTVSTQNSEAPDSITVTSNTSSECNKGIPVTLSVAAQGKFTDGTGHELTNPAGTVTALLSFTATTPTYSQIHLTTNKTGVGDWVPTTYLGSTADAFTPSQDGIFVTPAAIPPYLIKPDAPTGVQPSKTLFTIPTANVGLTGTVTVSNINYFIAIPANASPGTYTTTVRYELS
jgi:hypothetical protein